MSIKLKNLSKAFDGKIILDGFSYEFPSRGLVVLKADSGVGKTTLLRIISGLDKADSGEIIGVTPNSISYAFQEYRLFSHLDAIENVLIASFKNADGNDKRQAIDLLGRLRLTKNELSKLPPELSGGMKQRINLARAFLCDRPILMLDEPFKELDEELIRIVTEIIYEQAKSKLVILVTHQNELTADRIIDLGIQGK